MGASVNLGFDEVCTEIEPESWTLLFLFLEPINRVFTLVYFVSRNFFVHLLVLTCILSFTVYLPHSALAVEKLP